jgi:hypothetical protein
MVDQEGVAFCDSANLCKPAPTMLLFSQAPTMGPTQCLPGLLPQGPSSWREKLNTHFHLEPKLRTDGAIPPYTVALYQARENETHSRMLTCNGMHQLQKCSTCVILYIFHAANMQDYIYIYFLNISGFHIIVLFNLSKELVYIPSNTTK